MKRLLLMLVGMLLWGVHPASAQPSCKDEIPASQTRIWGSQSNFMSWPITTCMQSVTFDMNPDTGSFPPRFDRQNGPNRWPDVIPTGFQGPIEYTYCMFLRNKGDGAWDGSCVVQMWNGRVESTPEATTPPARVGENWFYNQSWGPLMDRNPNVGEEVGLGVCRGNCRLVSGNVADPPGSIAERSNIAKVIWGTPWAPTTPTEPPHTDPTGPTGPTGPTDPPQNPQPSGLDLSKVDQHLTDVEARILQRLDEVQRDVNNPGWWGQVRAFAKSGPGMALIGGAVTFIEEHYRRQ